MGDAFIEADQHAAGFVSHDRGLVIGAGERPVTVSLITADMRASPLASGSVDVVVSSLAIHNIPDRPGRIRAVGEAARVLRPGGRLVVADFRHARAYADRLAGLGLADVQVRDLGWRFWYGGPWGRTSAVTATR